MSGKKINKNGIQQAALRAFIYNVVLEVILWVLILFFISKQHLVTILPYELLLHLVIMLMLGIYGITVLVFVIGLLLECFKKSRDGKGSADRGETTA